jgi:hypothetical protein
MPCHQNAGQNYTIKKLKPSSNMAKLKYLGTEERNEDCIHEGIGSRLNLEGNCCCDSVQTRMSSRLLSKNVKD